MEIDTLNYIMKGTELSDNSEKNKPLNTKLTHTFLLKQVEQPQCIASQTLYTVKPFLIECWALIRNRQGFINANNMKSLFENVDMDGILSLREIKLDQKL